MIEEGVRIINGSKVKIRNERETDGHEQFQYLSGYDIWMWHCECGGGGVRSCCKHLRAVAI